MNNKELAVLMEIKGRKVNPSKESEEIAKNNGWVDAYYLSLEYFLPARNTQFVPTEKAKKLIDFRESFELFWREKEGYIYDTGKTIEGVLMSPKTMAFIIESLTMEEFGNFVAARIGESSTLFGYSVYRSNDIADNTFIFF